MPWRRCKRCCTWAQEFDPVGVAARDLRECLLIQLRRLGKENELPALLVRDHLEALGSRRFPDIARTLKVAVEEIHDATRLIATLEPKPGRIYTADATSYVTPEVTIQKVDGEYTVVLNNDQIPRLHISEHYRQLMADENTSTEVKNYIRDKARAWSSIKSINQRQQTIYNIAKEIITVQREFFAHGISTCVRSPWPRSPPCWASTKPRSAAPSPTSTCRPRAAPSR